MAKRILLADDSITIQKVISITFASEDYDLTVVGDGEAAIQKARELKPDLIMADVAMPGKTGYEVCTFVKNNPDLKDTPVLLLAGTFEPLNKDAAIRAGADDSIVKPFESQELLDKVRELLSRSGVVEMAVAPKAASAAQEVQTNDMWEAGDFLTLPEDFDEKKDDKSDDLDFLSSGALFEADEHKELSLPHEDFTDLVIHDEELKPIAEQDGHKFEPLSTEHSFDIGGFDGFKEEPERASFDLSAFELREEPKKMEPFEVESFDLEPFRPAKKEEPVIQPWELPVAEAKIEEKDFAEPDLLEIPEDALEAAPSPFAKVDEPRQIYERTFEAPRPIREVMASAPEAPKAPQFSEEEVAKALQRAADKVEARLIEDMNLKLGKAEAKVAEAIERVAARVEEKLRSDLGQKLDRVDSQVAQAIENTVARLESRLKAELGARLEKSLSVPREQIEAIVSKTSKQVIEHVAWEVLPELAERLIKSEINRVKDAFIKVRS
jgi:DNA-binding response OmpR family regulator